MTKNMKKLILDTDIGGDCDDAGALAVLHAHVDAGNVDLLAVTVDIPNAASAAAVRAINAYYGHPDIPVGLYHGAPDNKFVDTYATAVADAFGQQVIDAPDGVKLLRRILSENDAKDVTVCGIGRLTLLRELLESGPDEISPCSGSELIEKSVAELVLMGGYFDREKPIYAGDMLVTAEFNIAADVDSARRITENWPTPLTFAPYELGCKVITGARGVRERPDSPVSLAYRLTTGGGRESWDPIAVDFAAGAVGVYAAVPFGNVTVNDAGITDYAAGDGDRRYITAAAPIQTVSERIDALMIGKEK